MTYATVLLALFLQQTPSGSLYSDNAPNLFLFRDFKARNVNDILTIQIIESATATNSANTSTKKDGSVSVTAPNLGGLEKGASALNFANILAGTSALNFAGTGSTSRAGQLQAFVTARVTQLMPNGDMAIEGTKEVTINRERQVLRIRGLVRSRDVTPNNVILSTAIANMEVVFDGKGIVSDANKPGFLYRFFSWITPF
ncbi:MAG TPA: flagellar basal body L-ring protein FlgH [Terriglobia bacterium]|nr:flagellar basal body L-ring protein FlgH [Terriglobia bacterium]